MQEKLPFTQLDPNETFHAPAERFLTSTSRYSYIFMLLMLSASAAFADTTFVSGAVSGVWTRDGNPFVVVDSTWIPDGELLTLREGVEVFFEEGQGLYVFGEFAPRGGPGGRTIDSVFVREAAGVEHGRGLRFYGRNHSTLDYLSVICPDTTLMLDDSCWLTFNYCTIRSEVRGARSLARDPHDGPIESSRLEFNYTTYAGGHRFNVEGCYVNAQHSKFDLSYGEPRGNRGNPSAFYGWGTTYEFSHSEVIGSIDLGLYCETRISDCRFLDPYDGAIPGVGIDGDNPQLIRTYIEGTCGIGGLQRRQLIIEDNVITGDLGLSRYDIIVKDCRVGGQINIMGSASALIHMSEIGGGIELDEYAGGVVIDSCLIGYNRRNNHQFNDDIHISRDHDRVDFVRNVIFGRFYMHEFDGDEGEVVLDHNTIVVDSTIFHHAIESLIDRVTVTNNIIVNVGAPGPLYSRPDMVSELPVFKYNCLWGFDRFAGWPDTALIEPDSTNIIADPLLEWFGFSPLLAENSPCIDSGDPDAVEDPDGTRSDIGAWAFFQRNSVPRLPGNTTQPRLLSLNAFPSPTNGSFNLSFDLPLPQRVTVRLNDLLGREVLMLPGAAYGAGKHQVTLNASGIASGRYFVTLQGASGVAEQPVILVK